MIQTVPLKPDAGPAPSAGDDRQRRMAWWHEAKFGMFVHWGIYSVLGRGEQVMLRDWMPIEEYTPLAAAFHPVPDWADQVADQAVRAGARYAILTTRHHDGYCLFDTATDTFNAVRTGPGRDLVREYVAALRQRGLRVGLYYSLPNWRRRGFWAPERYPDEQRAIVDEIHAQVRELMSNYGPIDILFHLVDAVRQGGNCVFNIGPDARGQVCRRDGAALDRVGAWLRVNGEAIYGTRPGKILTARRQSACNQYGLFTCRQTIAYLILFYPPREYVILSKVGPAIRKARMLGSGQPLTVEPLANARWKLGGLPALTAEELAPVIRIEFEAEPYSLTFDDDAWLDGAYRAMRDEDVVAHLRV
ncbi:MAG: alpha-L-fucosidase [Kiritimatiellae bacterium]|nr:alpha-L-fucosidase [Kiritimatiellia bacterium]